ncbi:MAG: hypothetical protein NT113_25150 [Hyphomicrobiales bacterium]|nr:hypothetical protein [Hyphomicrobiales bacterium]
MALLLLLGIASALVWLNLDTVTDLLHGSAAPATSTASNADVLASATEPAVSAADFAAFQQRTGDAMQTATGLLNAQQTELKRLSDQVLGLTLQVSKLTRRIEQPSPSRASGAPAAVSTRPAGAISVGGAPLPAAR